MCSHRAPALTDAYRSERAHTNPSADLIHPGVGRGRRQWDVQEPCQGVSRKEGRILGMAWTIETPSLGCMAAMSDVWEVLQSMGFDTSNAWILLRGTQVMFPVPTKQWINQPNNGSKKIKKIYIYIKQILMYSPNCPGGLSVWMPAR